MISANQEPNRVICWVKMQGLKFDESEHRYTLEGRILPSVTGILDTGGLVDKTWFNDSARLRGTYVHKAVYLDCTVGVDPNTIDSTIRPYFSAWLKFKAQVKPVILGSEIRVLNRKLMYAGTLDLLLKIPGSELIYLVDIKTGAIQPWTAIQLAGYFDAENDLGIKPGARAGLQLASTGAFNFKPYENPNDFKVFQAAATIQNCKLRRI